MTSMVDLSALGVSKDPDLTADDWKDYEDTAAGSGFTGPVPKGVYDLQLPKTFGKEHFSATPDGYLQLKFDLTVANGPHKGATIKYVAVSVKKFTNSKASSAGNLLRACKVPVQPVTNEQWVQAFTAIQGRVFQGMVDWEARDKVNKVYYRGEVKFPLVDGVRQNFIDLTGQKDDQGRVKRAWAYNTINWFQTPPSAGKKH